MKVGFVNRSSAESVVGGDTVQMNETAKALSMLGVEVVRVQSPHQVDDSFDLLHFFNIIRPQYILPFLGLPQKKVVSTIYVDYSEYDQISRSGIGASIAKLLGKNRSEYMKTLIRHAKNQERLQSGQYLWKGHAGAIREVLKKVDHLLPNSQSEWHRLQKDFTCSKPYTAIPNAIDPKLFDLGGAVRKGLLCVAQIEGRKNQLNLIQALNALKLESTLIGKHAPNHKSYFELCRQVAGTHIQFHDFMPQEQLVEHYQKAAVHALPSWFETTGLSSLEAAACGCIPVVSDKGDVREYFSEIAEFCEPESHQSIAAAVERALRRNDHRAVRDYVHERFTWQITAEKTLAIYRSLT
jgi:glycosyltransferase involved in cell wall biosynthesis